MSETLTVRLDKNAIVIRLPISILPVVLEAAPFNCRSDDTVTPAYRVTNAAVFADEIVTALTREEEDGTTPVHLMFDAAMNDAIEDGCEGVEEIPLPSRRGGEGGA